MELKRRFVIRNPAFLFFSIVSTFMVFQIGVWIGRSWPDFPCPKQRNHHHPDQNNTGDNVKVPPPPESNVVPTSVRPIGKPTAFDESSIGNKDIIFNPRSGSVLETKLAAIENLENEKKKTNSPLQKGKKYEKDMVILPNKLNTVYLHRTIPDYVQIREADSPQTGDFNCGGSVIPNCCAFYVHGIEEAKKVCDSYSDYCKGFVLNAINSSPTGVKHLMYLKREVNQMSLNFLTDFFVKSKHMNKISWKNAI